MKLCNVVEVRCRRAYNGQAHLLTLIVDIGNGITHPISFFKLWKRMGWERWSARRIAAVKATAPKRVRVWWKTRNGQPWAELLDGTCDMWCRRIRAHLSQTAPETRVEPSALEVAQDAALVVFRNDSTVEPFVIDVGTHF